jgi:hypothetical protein
MRELIRPSPDMQDSMAKVDFAERAASMADRGNSLVNAEVKIRPQDHERQFGTIALSSEVMMPNGQSTTLVETIRGDALNLSFDQRTEHAKVVDFASGKYVNYGNGKEYPLDSRLVNAAARVADARLQAAEAATVDLIQRKAA